MVERYKKLVELFNSGNYDFYYMGIPVYNLFYSGVNHNTLELHIKFMNYKRGDFIEKEYSFYFSDDDWQESSELGRFEVYPKRERIVI